MKLGYLCLFFIALNTAWAGPLSETIKTTLEAQSSCGNFVRYDDTFLYLGFGPYMLGADDPRKPIPGKVHVTSFDGSRTFDLATDDSAIDLVSDHGHAFVLTYSALEEWDLASGVRIASYPTYVHDGVMKYKEHAQGMARFQDLLVIAHGRLGVSFFDLKTKRLVNQYRLIQEQLPLESMATGVTVQGNLAYVVMDNFSLVPSNQPQAFRGIVVIDMLSQSVVVQAVGMDEGADAVASDGGKLIVSFMGQPLWKFSLGSLNGTKMPEPELKVWGFPMDGHPSGRATMDENYYYTCFLKAPSAGRGGVYHPVPMALSRKQLMLD